MSLSLFEYNTAVSGFLAHSFGGAVFAHNTFVVIMKCSFKRNQATRSGGAVHTEGKKLIIKSSLFEYNEAVNNYTAATVGGLVFASSAEIFDCNFKGNRAVVSRKNALLFKDNIATHCGGAIYTYDKDLVIKLSIFEYNTVVAKYTTGTLGGAVFATTNSIVEILHCSFRSTKVSFVGGAIYMKERNWSLNHQNLNITLH